MYLNRSERVVNQEVIIKMDPVGAVLVLYGGINGILWQSRDTYIYIELDLVPLVCYCMAI